MYITFSSIRQEKVRRMDARAYSIAAPSSSGTVPEEATTTKAGDCRKFKNH